MTVQMIAAAAQQAATPFVIPEAITEGRSLSDRAETVAAIAATHAIAVDRDGRFPAEALAAARAEKLLGLMVPRDLGGEGIGVSAVADICFALGRSCASTAMIYAMHQVKVACIVRHAHGAAWHDMTMQRLVRDQLLFASSTTEGQNGGNVRSSAAPVEQNGSTIELERAATVISYGAEADGIITTARRSAEASSGDQVLAVFLKDDYTLERLNGWDTLGMRGTGSVGFQLRARGAAAQIVPERYDRIHANTMTPVSHLLWSSVWAGIATKAVERAQHFIRHATRKAGGQQPPGAGQYGKACSSLSAMRALIATMLDRYERALADPKMLESIDFQNAITMLKVDASELAVATVMSAMRACGLSGYRQDGDFSLGRHLRDILSAPIMVHNDRIVASAATAALMASVPKSLRG